MTPELSNTERTTIAQFLRAATNPNVVTAVAGRDDEFLAGWLNNDASPAVNAWPTAVDSRTLFESTDVTKFDGLTAGKRAAWDRIERFAPIDFHRQKMRAAIVDCWGATDAATICINLVRKVSRVEVLLTPNVAENQATTATVTALRLKFNGPISVDEVGRILNDF